MKNEKGQGQGVIVNTLRFSWTSLRNSHRTKRYCVFSFRDKRLIPIEGADSLLLRLVIVVANRRDWTGLVATLK